MTHEGKCLQVNLNVSRVAGDGLYQFMLENGISLACVSEPNVSSLKSVGWFSSHSELAAVFWIPQFLDMPVILVHRARDFVTVKIGDVYVTSIYVSPNKSVKYFADFLMDFKTFYLSIGCPLMTFCGDFNARSQFWGDIVCNRKREVLEEWAAEMDFRLCNVGNTFTCVRPQGSSIPDTTWCSFSCLNRISHWSVLLGMESLSDHAYIFFKLRFGPFVPSSRVTVATLDGRGKTMMQACLMQLLNLSGGVKFGSFLRRSMLPGSRRK